MNKGIIKRGIAVVVISTFMFTGCSMLAKSRWVQEATLNMISPALPDVFDAALTLRSGTAAQDGIAGLCLLVAALTEMTPENYDFLCTASLAFTAYGFLYEEDDPKKAVEMLRIGQSYGWRACMLNSDISEAFEEGGYPAVKTAINELDDKDMVPALMWTAMSWGFSSLLTMSKETMALQYLYLVEAMAFKVYELDRTYFHGLPELFQMFYAAYLPPMMGGTVEKVEKHYKLAMEVSKGGLLLTDIFYVQHYLIPYEKHERAIKMLQHVVDVSHDKYPKLALFNEIAKKKARYMLANKDKLLRGY